MKVLILATLVASISAGWFDQWNDASTPPTDQIPSTTTGNKYESGKEYIYEFESQVLTSLPTFTKSHGGVKIRAQVKLDFVSTTDGILQLSGTEMLSLNHEISDPSNLPPTKQLTSDTFAPLPSDQATMIKAKLELPIKFRYENGKITWIEVADKETNWSIDLKRSILSMLQVRLQADSTSSNPQLSYNDLKNTKSTAFSFLEPALDGTCYSEVSVKADTHSQESNQFKIVKTRNPTDCLKVNSQYQVVRPQTIDQCRCEVNLDQKPCQCRPTAEEYIASNPGYFGAKTMSEYVVVSADAQNLMIKSCVQSATYRYEFPDAPDQYLATFSNQTLKLVQQKDDQTISTNNNSWRRVNDPWKVQILKQDEEQPMMTKEQIVSTAQKQISDLESISKQKSQFPLHFPVFMQLVETLKICQKPQLDQLYQANTFSTSFRKWRVLVDALAHCNTTVCDDFLMDKMVAGQQEFPSIQASNLLMLWSANKVPSIHTIEKFRDTVIPGFQKSEEQKLAYNHALLCFGSLVRRYIHSEEINQMLCALKADKDIHQSNIDKCQSYSKVLESRLDDAKTDEDKITALKALTNMGSLQALPKIQKMLERTESTGVRVHAVYAVKNLCFQNRLKVLQTVAPLLTNQKEDTEVRMAAFLMYMRCDPSATQLHKIVDEERDLDLKTYFVQYLRNELRAYGPKQDNRRQKAKLVLSKVKAFHMSPHSGSMRLQYGLKPDDNGNIRSRNWLTNQTSPYPRSASLRMETLLRGAVHPSFEMAIRAENVEALFEQIMQQLGSPTTPRSRVDNSPLKSMLGMRGLLSDHGADSSLSMPFIISGQEASNIYIDKNTISRYMASLRQNNEIVIPIRWFQTFVAPQEKNRRLQNNGMWLVNQRATGGIIDIDGQIRIQLPGQGRPYPVIGFDSNKMVRLEEATATAQGVEVGFCTTGVKSMLANRYYSGEQQWNLTYSVADSNLTLQVSKPSQDMMVTQLEGNTYTFYAPTRLPVSAQSTHRVAQPIITQEPDRLTFNKELQAPKSVELSCKVEGDVYMPQLYSFVRDRLSLMPSCFSMKKQHVQLSVSPASSSPRDYTFTIAVRRLGGEQMYRRGSSSSSSSSSSESSSSKSSSSSSSSSEERNWNRNQNQSPETLMQKIGNYLSSDRYSDIFSQEINNRVNRLSMGSVHYIWQGRISATSGSSNLTMSANLTSQYDYDQPTVHQTLVCDRPPIRGQENERSVLSATVSKSVNPSASQLISTYSLAWGPQSKPTQHTIQMNEQHRPVYKDGACYEQTAYGCKDQFGVFYPVWYNQTSQIQSRNTDIVAQLLNATHAYRMNSADKIIIQTQGPAGRDTIDMTKVYRSNSDLVDVAYTLNGVHYNMSKVYLPFVKLCDELRNEKPFYPISIDRPVSQFVPSHHRSGPFSIRDKCVVENAKAMTMDWKQLAIPKSDCEVVLLDTCNNGQQPQQQQQQPQQQQQQPQQPPQQPQQPQQQQLRVTLKANAQQQSVESKIVKLQLDQTEIEVQFHAGSSFSQRSIKVKVNGEEKPVHKNQPIIVEQQQQQHQQQQQGQQIAIIKCDDNQCEVKSDQQGLYLAIDEQTVRLELENGRSRAQCGLCSAHPEISGEQADYQTSVKLFKQNRVSDQGCSIEERRDQAERFNQQHQCTTLRVHRVVKDNNGKTCISVDKLPMCSRHCENKRPEPQNVPVKCVDKQTADRLGLTIDSEGDQRYVRDDAIINRIPQAEQKNLDISVARNCN